MDGHAGFMWALSLARYGLLVFVGSLYFSYLGIFIMGGTGASSTGGSSIPPQKSPPIGPDSRKQKLEGGRAAVYFRYNIMNTWVSCPDPWADPNSRVDLP